MEIAQHKPELHLYEDVSVYPWLSNPTQQALLEDVEASDVEHTASRAETSAPCTEVAQANVKPAADSKLHSRSKALESRRNMQAASGGDRGAGASEGNLNEGLCVTEALEAPSSARNGRPEFTECTLVPFHWMGEPQALHVLHERGAGIESGAFVARNIGEIPTTTPASWCEKWRRDGWTNFALKWQRRSGSERAWISNSAESQLLLEHGAITGKGARLRLLQVQVALEELEKVCGVQKGDVSSLHEAIAAAQPTSTAENRHKLQAHMAKLPLMGQDSSYDGAKFKPAHLSKQPAASETNPSIFPQVPTGGPRALRYPISQHSQLLAPKVRPGMCQQQAPEAAMADSTNPYDPAAMELSDPQSGHCKAPQQILHTHDEQAFEVVPGIRPPQEASGEPGHDHSDPQPDRCAASQRGLRTHEEQGVEEIPGAGPAREDFGDALLRASAAVAAMDSLTGSHPTCKAKRTSSPAHAGMLEQPAASQPGLCALAEASHLIQAPAQAQHESGATACPLQKQHATSQQGLCGHETYAQEAAASSAVEGSGCPQITVSAALAALDNLTGDLNPSITKSSPLPANRGIPKATGEAQDGLCLHKDNRSYSETEIKDSRPLKEFAPDLRRLEVLGGPGSKAGRTFPAGKGKSRPPYARGSQDRKRTKAESCAHRDEQLQEEADFSDSCPIAIAAPRVNRDATMQSQGAEKELQRSGQGKSRPPSPLGALKGHTAEVQGRPGAQDQQIRQIVPSIGASAGIGAAIAAAPRTKAPSKDKSKPPLPRAVSTMQRPGALAEVLFCKRICRAVPCPRAAPGKQQSTAQGKLRFRQQLDILSPATAKGGARAGSKGMVHPQKKQQGMDSDSTADTAAGETASARAAKARLQNWKKRQGLMRRTVTSPPAPSGTAGPAAAQACAAAPAAANKEPICRNKSQDRHQHPAAARGSAATTAAQACAAIPAPAAADKTAVGGDMSQDRPPYAEALLAVPRTLGQKDKRSTEPKQALGQPKRIRQDPRRFVAAHEQLEGDANISEGAYQAHFNERLPALARLEAAFVEDSMAYTMPMAAKIDRQQRIIDRQQRIIDRQQERYFKLKDAWQKDMQQERERAVDLQRQLIRLTNKYKIVCKLQNAG